MSHQERAFERIRTLARQTERRLRLDRTIRAGVWALCGALAVSIVDVAARKLGWLAERPARIVLFAAAAGLVAVVVWAWLRRLPPAVGARALDRFHGLHDRMASALGFAELPPQERTPFMAAAIADADAFVPRVSPRGAAPIRAPRSLGAVAGLAAVLAAVVWVHARRPPPAVAQARPLEGMELSADDLDDAKNFAQKLDRSSADPDTKAAIGEFNRLVDDLAHRRLDRTEAFRRMAALEDKLLTGSEANKKTFEEQVARIGEELKHADLTKPAGEALSEGRFDQARDALKKAADRLKSANKPVDKAKLEELRQALEKAAADAAQRQSALERRREDLADEILKLKQKMGDAGSDEERSLLEKKQRELDRLDRDLEGQKTAGRQLDRLDRELAQAAEDLMHDLGVSAQDLDRGAEDLDRMQDQQMSEQEKEELRQKLQELRELVRQQGQGGKGQMVRLARFGRMARGQGGSQGQQGQGGDPQDGQGDGTGSGNQGSQGSQGQGGQQQAQGGSGGQGGETWIVGPGGQKVLLLSQGRGSTGAGDSSGGGPADRNRSHRNWGEGHDSHVEGQATNPNMATEDTQVQGNDTGQGGSRSQVILGAAERGFASHRYERVYTEYHQVAEESLSKEEIPGGYRFYVKRYFQLIRPREAR